jgi:hypothetical protein
VPTCSGAAAAGTQLPSTGEKNVLFKSGYLQIKSARPGRAPRLNARKNLTIKISLDLSLASSPKVLSFGHESHSVLLT